MKQQLPIALLILSASFTFASAAEDDVIALLTDTRFESGFTVWKPKSGQHVAQGTIRPRDVPQEPVWGLAQWFSRFSLANAPKQTFPDGRVRYFDGAKSVTFFPREHEADIALALNGNIEYEGKAPEPGVPWPHLLAERSLHSHPAISELRSVHLHVRYRLVKEKIFRPQGFDKRRHTAQFVFYITVQNQNPKSDGFLDYYWFGVPMYDTRYRIPPAHKAVDLASDRKLGTGKFIFNPGGDRYTNQSAHDRKWITINQELLPLMREGLETAWQQGYLLDSRNLADYQLTSMNTGWEVTGPIDVEVQISDLKLIALRKDSNKPSPESTE